MKKIHFFLLVLSCAYLTCKSFNQEGNKKNEVDVNSESQLAKWYFYCSVSSNNDTAYYFEHKLESPLDSQTKGISPLECDIKISSQEKVSVDTTNYYFKLYYKDTLNVCTIKPLGQIGISCVRKELYLPIYTHIVFDPMPDTTIFKMMKNEEKNLIELIKGKNNSINPWLFEYAKTKGLL